MTAKRGAQKIEATGCRSYCHKPAIRHKKTKAIIIIIIISSSSSSSSCSSE